MFDMSVGVCDKYTMSFRVDCHLDRCYADINLSINFAVQQKGPTAPL